MSSGVSSPIHRYSADIESLLYDQNFTADISNRMRVPAKILVTGEDENYKPETTADIDGQPSTNFIHTSTVGLGSRSAPPEAEIHDKVNTMQVPDRIILSGHEEHLAARAPPRELHLEQIMSVQPSVIRVETPPRVLTLEDHFFPTVDEDSDNEDKDVDEKVNHVSSNGTAVIYSKEMLADGTALDTSLLMSGPTEDVSVLRRQMIKLNRRVARLENESQNRQQREILVYTFGVAYFVLKTFLWLHRHW